MYESSRILFSGITAPLLSLCWLWASSAMRHARNDTNIIPSERYNLIYLEAGWNYLLSLLFWV